MYHYFRDMAEDISQEFRLKTKKKERNDYFIKEIDQNELMSNKNKKVYTTLNYIAYFLTLVFSVTRGISIFTFAPHFAILLEL